MRRLLLLTALLALLAPAAARAATRHVVRGAGFGHGVGMSQYGAYGYAKHGRDYRQILAHYYRDTDLTRASGRPVRVLLQASDPYVRFRGATTGPGGRRLRPDHTYVVRRAGRGTLRIAGVGTFRSPVRVKGPRVMRLMGRAINGIRSGLYRGSFELRPGAAGGVTAVNSLPLDSYVQGVVAGEMPSSWHIQALRAQAVAARTYGLATRRSGTFDAYPDTRSQVYRGVFGETSRSDRAVRDTRSQILTHDGEVATTYFFSTSGGRTEDVENSVLGRTPLPWLKSVDDPYDDISPRHRWRFSFSTRSIGARLRSPGTFQKIRVLKRGRSPRIVRARVYGSRGTRVLTGPQIRARLGLYDTWAFFTTVSTSQVSKARAGASRRRLGLPEIAGLFDPAPRSRSVLVERRRGGLWGRVGQVQTSRRGRYRLTVASAGTYRVRSGAVAGPGVRVR